MGTIGATNLDRPFRILLAEDNEDDVELLRRQLEKSRHAYDLRVVGNGAGVFNHIIDAENNTAWPDIIILDINMPCVTGFEVLRALRRFGAMKEVPVLMLTGSLDENEIKRTKELGARGYITKGNSVALDEIMAFTLAAKEDPELWIHVRRGPD
jgi:CheY-like chemotaxis protein